jgi:hypothetical protein
MKKLWISLGLVLILVMVAVPVGAITWGQPDTKHTNVGAMVVDWPGYGPWQVCSGTLINPRVFLTAGHCTDGWEGTGVETFWVNFDQDALNADTLLEVEEVITHPEYWWGPTSNPHDVGILILAASRDHVRGRTSICSVRTPGPAQGLAAHVSEPGHGRWRHLWGRLGWACLLDGARRL